jgi:prolyl oligopeptidase
MNRRPFLALSLVLASVPVWAQPAAPALPIAPVRNAPETFFGTTVDDPYRDFENVKSPAVAQWMKAHSDFAHKRLSSLPGRAELRARLEQLDASAAARVTGVQRAGRDLYFYERRAPQDDQFKLYVRQGLTGPEKLLFDPEPLKKKTGKAHAINYFSASPDGKRVALGVSAGGSEEAALRVLDVATGKQIGPEISRAQFGSVSWTPDGQELFFHRMQALAKGQAATDKYQRSMAVVMKPGAGEAGVRTVLRAGDDKNGLGIPATEFPLIDVQPDGRVLAYVIDGVSPEFRAWHTTLAALRAGKPNWQKLFDKDDGVTSLAVAGDRAYALTYKGAPRYRLLAGKLDGFSPATAQVLMPESQRVLTGLAAASDGLYIELREGNVKKLLRAEHKDGAQPVEVPLPVAGAFSLSSSSARADRPGVLIDLESWTRARQIYAVAPDGTVGNTGLQPAGPFDAPADVVATEVMVKSHDGAMVPMSIIHKKDTKLDGSNPTILYGYASYGITEEPFFSLGRLAWMEQGGVFAVANPRGSAVFGRDWHEAGKKTTKPNTWRDFIACAEHLVAQKWTSPAKLGIWGGSAGGILVGRAMTERPDLFAAVVPAVGALDAIRFETTPNGIPNIPEFGSRKTEEGFRALLAMSTYHHIKDGVNYPAVLLTHGVNDPRVEVWNTTKAAARLLAAQATATGEKKPVLMRLDYDSGHGIGSTKSQALDERADTYAFFLWQMGHPKFQPQGKL